jgi:NTP pyrophosphatase (non-canonical NTP hydrolase)
MSSLKDLQQRVADFVAARDWSQFHDDPKGTLLALGGEVGELMEIYRFTTEKDAQERSTTRKDDVEDEVADILYVLLMFCEENGIDLEEAFLNKERKREAKYPVKKFKGVNAKYDAV